MMWENAKSVGMRQEAPVFNSIQTGIIIFSLKKREINTHPPKKICKNPLPTDLWETLLVSRDIYSRPKQNTLNTLNA